MTQLIETPHTYSAERRYIISVLLREFLELDIYIKSIERNTSLGCDTVNEFHN
jgi:hypothetical protein